MYAVCELAEALRDSIVEYQVRTSPKAPHCRQSSLLTRRTVYTTKGNLRAELQIDCKLLVVSFEGPTLTRCCRMQVGYVYPIG